MAETQTELIDVERLRIGHYIHLDLGWMAHPFPLSSFKIRSPDQIDTLRSLGLERVRYSPERSDPDPAAAEASPGERSADTGAAAPAASLDPRRQLLEAQRMSLEKCERLFTDATRAFRRISDAAHSQPETAGEAVQALIQGMSDDINGQRESCIRLLSESVGEGSSHHAVNVTVISLLLAKACGLGDAAMREVGMGALLHDVGRDLLPERLRFGAPSADGADKRAFQEHVRHSLETARRMGVPRGALLVIAQHHEYADGSGYPQGIDNGQLSPASRIVGLVDKYDELCNPSNPAQAMTPYEAMSHLFAQRKRCFDERTLAVFVRMMGVYPPGSIVQLSDDRYALVVSVSAQRPLRPSVVIHDPTVPREEAPVVDLGSEPGLGIRRSLRPLQLPKATFDYLSPRQRMCYFFEHGRAASMAEAA